MSMMSYVLLLSFEVYFHYLCNLSLNCIYCYSNAKSTILILMCYYIAFLSCLLSPYFSIQKMESEENEAGEKKNSLCYYYYINYKVQGLKRKGFISNLLIGHEWAKLCLGLSW